MTSHEHPSDRPASALLLGEALLWARPGTSTRAIVAMAANATTLLRERSRSRPRRVVVRSDLRSGVLSREGR